MKTVEETRRELFYAWADKAGLPHSMLTCGEWAAFNAALDAVEIELPREVEMKSSQEFDHGIEAGYSSALEDVRAAIESINLGIKIL